MRFNSEDLLKIEKSVSGLLEVKEAKFLDVFVGGGFGEMYLQADLKEKHFRQQITMHMSQYEPKELVIDRFAHDAAHYFNFNSEPIKPRI